MKTLDAIRHFLHMPCRGKGSRREAELSLSDILRGRKMNHPEDVESPGRRSGQKPETGPEKERLEEVVQHEPNYDPIQEALDLKAAREHEQARKKGQEKKKTHKDK